MLNEKIVPIEAGPGGEGVSPSSPPAAGAEPQGGLDYLSFLLDELAFASRDGEWERIRPLEEMINRLLDGWGLREKQEVFLSAILAERHGLSLEEPK